MGDGQAIAAVGRCYIKGIGVKLSRRTSQGRRVEQAWSCFGIEKTVDKAIEWWTRG